MLPTKSHRIERKAKKKNSGKRKADGWRSLEDKDNLLVYWDTFNCDEVFQFEGTMCIVDFLDWLTELAQDFKLTVLAYNSQGLTHT